MYKTVELSLTACRWFTRHDFITEEQVKDVVKFALTNKRERINEDCFIIKIRKKKDHKYAEITIRYKDEQNRYFVYRLHSRGI